MIFEELPTYIPPFVNIIFGCPLRPFDKILHTFYKFKEPKAGEKAILTCESGSSNPTARIVWRYKNKHYNGQSNQVKSGEFGGNITTNMLEIQIKPEDHGAIIICEAINDELQESTHNAQTLSVKCKLNFLLFF